MDWHRKRFHDAYSPYKREALYCFLIDTVVSIGCVVTILLTNMYLVAPMIFLIIPAFYVVELVVNYRIALFSVLEMQRKLFITEKLCIIKIREENSASGHWGSIIPQLYPQNMYVGRYRIVCKDEKGKKVFLRCVMSGKKWQMIHDNLERFTLLPQTITYGRYSHVVLFYCNKDELASVLNHIC